MPPKSKAPAKKSDDEKAAEKAAKAKEKALADFLKAAKNGDLAKVEKAVAAGMHVDEVNEKGQAAAHYAAAFGSRKVLRFLYSKGADFALQTTDKNKHTPLSAARAVGETEAAKFIEALLSGTGGDVADEDSDDSDADADGSGASTTASGQLVWCGTRPAST